ncbi:MAG: ribosomal protein L16, partial [Candidatus Omnitrophica bacterium]|nr:ribosomal protein L16 [Candidatus Omnitrophota bacterium]
WVAVVRRGKVVFEIGGVPEDYARDSFRLIAYKLPFKTMFVTRNRGI